MSEKLKETGRSAFGFKVADNLSPKDVRVFEPRLEFFIAERKRRPIGVLADLTDVSAAAWTASWDDMRFLQKHSDHIARLAVVGALQWEEVVDIFIAGAAVVQSEMRYFHASEIEHAQQWART